MECTHVQRLNQVVNLHEDLLWSTLQDVGKFTWASCIHVCVCVCAHALWCLCVWFGQGMSELCLCGIGRLQQSFSYVLECNKNAFCFFNGWYPSSKDYLEKVRWLVTAIIKCIVYIEMPIASEHTHTHTHWFIKHTHTHTNACKQFECRAKSVVQRQAVHVETHSTVDSCH